MASNLISVPAANAAPSSKMNPLAPQRSPGSRPWRRALAVSGWTLAALAALDLSVNRLFPMPSGPGTESASSLATYFDYGRSATGKLERMVGPSDDRSQAIAQAGWLGGDRLAQLPNQLPSPLPHSQPNLPTQSPPADAPLVAFYGMSFTVQLGEALAELSPAVAQRHVAAPSAGPSYAFAAYQADQAQQLSQPSGQQPDVVVMGILASSVKSLQTMTAATWLFEGPSPYTYPRYRLEQGELVATPPLINSLAELRRALAEPALLRAYEAQLAEQDRYYNAFLFNRSWLDHSAIARMVRRSFAQRHDRQLEASLYNDRNGFIDPETNALLQAMVERFGATARERGQLPVVLLLDSENYNDHLLQLLGPTLERGQIPHLSTHTVAPADDPRNYLPDSHFTPAVNRELARTFTQLVAQERPDLAAALDPIDR